MPIEHKRIKIGDGFVEAILIRLQSKNLILLRGSKGYLMCGYLNLKVAEKFKDAAVKIVGVSTINQVLAAKVHTCTAQAKKLGIYKDQPVRQVLEIIK